MTKERKLEVLKFLYDKLLELYDNNKLTFLCNLTRNLYRIGTISKEETEWVLKLTKKNRPNNSVGILAYWSKDDFESRKEFIKMLINKEMKKKNDNTREIVS